MKIVETREQILDLLIDVEINPKEVLKVNIKDNYINNQLNTALESFLLDDDFTRSDFNQTLMTLTKTVTNKYN